MSSGSYSREIDSKIERHKQSNQAITVCMSMVTEVAVALEEMGQKDKVTALEKVVLSFLQLERKTADHITALGEVKDKIHAGELEKPLEEQDELASIFQEKVTQLESQREQNEAKFRRHPKMREFRQKVWSVNHPEEALPEEQGSDIVFVNPNRQDFLCPITRGLFEEPMRNKNCGHHYSRKAILDHLKGSRGKGKVCPVAGCNANVTEQSLEVDADLERKARQHKQQLQAADQQEDSEEEEI